MSIVYREETVADLEQIRRVNTEAFGQAAEADLVDTLRREGHATLSLVAAAEDEVRGHILFSDLPIDTESGPLPTVALAPMAVLPQFQRQGIGSQLVRHGLEICRGRGFCAVLVLGHVDYYPRFGFSAKLAQQIASPFSGDAFMAAELAPGALKNVRGRVEYPPPFFA